MNTKRTLACIIVGMAGTCQAMDGGDQPPPPNQQHFSSPPAPSPPRNSPDNFTVEMEDAQPNTISDIKRLFPSAKTEHLQKIQTDNPDLMDNALAEIPPPTRAGPGTHRNPALFTLANELMSASQNETNEAQAAKTATEKTHKNGMKNIQKVGLPAVAGVVMLLIMQPGILGAIFGTQSDVSCPDVAAIATACLNACVCAVT